MAQIELGAPYYIYTPTQADYVAINAPSDPNFVGYATDVTGLDDAGVRENAQVNAAGDGGYHGPFWRDRRPWTISGFIMPSFPLASRSAAVNHLEGVMGQCMRADGFLQWVTADGLTRFITFRKQQPTRDTKGQSNVQRNFLVAGVAADWRILQSGALSSVVKTGLPVQTVPSAVNTGNADAAPKFTITGPWSGGNLTIANVTTGKQVVLLNPTILSGHTWTLDFTGTYPTLVDDGGVNHYGLIDATNTNFDIAVAGTETVTGGANSFQYNGSGASAASGLQVQWRNSWT